MRTALIFLLLASSAVAQEKTGTTTPSACGPLDVKFEVNRNESKSIEPEPAKALVYVVEDIGRPGSRCLVGCATVRVGLDGAWIGANHGTSHFLFFVEPGEHHLCANWQSTLGRLSSTHSLANFTADAGEVYYFRARVWASDRRFLALDPVNADEGRYLVATSPLSVSRAKN